MTPWSPARRARWLRRYLAVDSGKYGRLDASTSAVAVVGVPGVPLGGVAVPMAVAVGPGALLLPAAVGRDGRVFVGLASEVVAGTRRRAVLKAAV